MKDRIMYFDQMKGIAILLVVIGHVMQFSFGIHKSDIVDMLGIFHMPVFFFISGFFSYKDSITIRDAIFRCVSRARCLLLPYIVFLIIWSIFEKTVVVDLLLNGGERYWFLNALFIVSFIYILLNSIIGRVANDYLFISLALMPVAVIKIIMKFNFSLGGVICLPQLDTFAIYFVVGFLCRKYERLFDIFSNNGIIYALSFAFFMSRWYLFGMSNIILNILGSLGAIIVILQFLQTVDNNSVLLDRLSLLGRESLSIYMLHYFFIPDMSKLVEPMIDISNPYICHFIASMLLSIPIVVSSLFLGSLINKNTYLKFILLGKINSL